MAQAAIPKYLDTSFETCPPGHRFMLYGKLYQEGSWERVKDVKPDDLKQFLEVPKGARDLRDALRKRQDRLADLHGDAMMTLAAKGAAPFLTGTGIEHPLENGMAFLSPYGLPYLPGSSVKGVLRRAAELLAEEGEGGWSECAVNHLFGSDKPDAPRGGALVFWDVFPECDRLEADIMNPHHGDYYNDKEPPHDAGNPVPIHFLALPQNTRFVFHVCHRPHSPADQPVDWQILAEAAFEEAFGWLGFGAKTAVGYGAMERDAKWARQRTEAREEGRKEREEAARRAAMTPARRAIAQCLDERTDKKEPESTTVFEALRQARLKLEGEDKIEAAEWIRDKMQQEKRWRESPGPKKRQKQHERTQTVLRWLRGE